jgi:hypothetical protein
LLPGDTNPPARRADATSPVGDKSRTEMLGGTVTG